MGYIYEFDLSTKKFTGYIRTQSSPITNLMYF